MGPHLSPAALWAIPVVPGYRVPAWCQPSFNSNKWHSAKKRVKGLDGGRERHNPTGGMTNVAHCCFHLLLISAWMHLKCFSLVPLPPCPPSCPPFTSFTNSTRPCFPPGHSCLTCQLNDRLIIRLSVRRLAPEAVYVTAHRYIWLLHSQKKKTPSG